MTSPRVSVICIFLNEAPFLAEAIDAVLAQDFQDFELLLCDDGSTDGSSEIARDYAVRFPERILYLDHPGHANRGMSATRNLGLAHARGEFITMIDGDDRCRPNKLSGQVRALDAEPDIAMVSGCYRYWASWSGGKDMTMVPGPIRGGVTYPPDTSLMLYPLGRGLNPHGPMIRRELVERVGGYVESFTGLYEDQVFLAKIYLETPIRHMRDIWFDYRVHPRSCTATVTAAGWRDMRRKFLQWFEAYIADKALAGKDELYRAIRRAHWELDHPLVHATLEFLRWRKYDLWRWLRIIPPPPSD